MDVRGGVSFGDSALGRTILWIGLVDKVKYTIKRFVEAEIIQTFILTEDDFEGMNPATMSQDELDDFIQQFSPDYEEINERSDATVTIGN